MLVSALPFDTEGVHRAVCAGPHQEAFPVSQCPSCRSTNLIVVHMTIGSDPVRFTSCRACEHRWWTDLHADRLLPLDEVLDRVAA